MAPFDYDYVESLMERIRHIPETAKPAWGSFTPRQMVSHLADIVRYSMGRGPVVPVNAGWFSRWCVAPLLMHGILRPPRNLALPAELRPGNLPWPPADVEDLHALLEDYLARVQAGDLRTAPHPAFGDVGIDGWARLHIVHFEHHLRQFCA